MQHIKTSKPVDPKPPETNKSALVRYLTLYDDEVEVSDVNLEELTRFAWDRLTLLQKVEQISKDFTARISPDDKDGRAIKAALVQFFSMDEGSIAFMNPQLTPKLKDVLSHQIIRLALCLDLRLSGWLLRAETYLFRFRFEYAEDENRGAFFQQANLKFNKCTQEEIKEHEHKLRILYKIVHKKDNLENGVYKVDFLEAMDSVAGRRTLLVNGDALIFPEDLIDLVVPIFRTKVNAQIALARAKVRNHWLDPNLQSTFSSIIQRCNETPSEYTKKTETGSISVESLPELSEKSFPLCMRFLYEKVKETNHAKHGARMQLGLFLKSIGLSLDDSMTFWRREFTKKIGNDVFDKQYAYNIRHNYGKEGKMTDYAPYGCSKIISDSVSTGDTHGCPYKHFNESDLRAYVLKRGISEIGATEIVALKRTKEYQLACKKYFELSHGVKVEAAVSNHPNTYFDESFRILNPKKDAKAPTSAASSQPKASQMSATAPSASQSKPQPTASQSDHPDADDIPDDF